MNAVLRVGVEHSPKPTVLASRRAAGQMDEHTATIHPDLWAADFNRRLPEVRKAFPGYTAHMAQVVGILTHERAVKLLHFEHYDVIPGASDDDHPGLMGTAELHGGQRVPVAFLNLIGAVSSTDRGPFGDRMLTVARDRLNARGGGVILACEADDVGVCEILHPNLWHTAHRAAPTLDGVLISVSRNVGTLSHATWHPGAPKNPESDARPILTANVNLHGKVKS